tara:strand:+ start:47 stop:418 length:372 start_codon:yes stop_codon:yes gene_type:complete
VRDARTSQEAGRLSKEFNAGAKPETHAGNAQGESGVARSLREHWEGAQQQDRDAMRTDPRLTEEGALRDDFDAAAKTRHEGDGDDDGDDDGRKPRKSWKQRAQEKGQRRGHGRGGYGMKRGGN